MNQNDNAWALKQAAKYAQKYAEAKEGNQQLLSRIESIEELLAQAQKEVQYLKKLNHSQQLYIEKLEVHLGDARTPNDATLRTISPLMVVKDDAC